MIPYIKIPDLSIHHPFRFIGLEFDIPIHPFGLLVATGVIIGTALATRRARRRGFDLDMLNSFITWMLLVGFIGGHVLDEIFYHPDEIARDPISLIKLWAGLSSFGGFTGAFIGIFLWKYFDYIPMGTGPRWGFVRNASPRPILPFADLILSVFPVAWIFGRSGCSSVHDHPGAVAGPSDFLAVTFPSANPAVTDGAGVHHSFGPITFIDGHFPRYDLGLLELMFTILLAGLIALTWRKKLPTGTYIVVTSLAYAPVRFAMDFLRIRGGEGADPRYADLTPAQWECTALFAFGLYMLWVVLRNRSRGIELADALKVKPARRESASVPGAVAT